MSLGVDLAPLTSPAAARGCVAKAAAPSPRVRVVPGAGGSSATPGVAGGTETPPGSPHIGRPRPSHPRVRNALTTVPSGSGPAGSPQV